VRVLLVLALVACSSKKPDDAKTRFPILPDKLQLGEIGFVMAIDLHALDLDQVGGYLPPELGCARELIKAANVGVLTESGATWEGHVTGLEPVQVFECSSKLAPVIGVEVHRAPTGVELTWQGTHVVVAWHGDDAVITQAGNAPRTGEMPMVIQDLISRVPRDVKGWIVSSGFPQYKIGSTVAWLQTTAETWTFTVLVESIEIGAARPFIDSIVDGFKTTARAKGARVDDSWFAVESTPTTAKLVATVPISAFGAAR
jgi:hypothetical protein